MPKQDLPREEILDRCAPELALLLEVREIAADLECDPWEFAVEIGRLPHSVDVASRLRWLIFRGYVEHRREVGTVRSRRRIFQKCRNVKFTPASCFMLTISGRKVARVVRDSMNFVSTSPGNGHAQNGSAVIVTPKSRLIPSWDPIRRELWVANIIVKQFRVPAKNQEAILNAFHEEGWPDRIDDPLTPIHGREARQRLREAIRSLNESQKRRLIRFFGDGSGGGVGWELLSGRVH